MNFQFRYFSSRKIVSLFRYFSKKYRDVFGF